VLLSLHTIDICHQCFHVDKDLGTGLTPVNVRSVVIDCISCDAFIAMLHIDSRKRRLVMAIIFVFLGMERRNVGNDG
jgi:hypothetical protein